MKKSKFLRKKKKKRKESTVEREYKMLQNHEMAIAAADKLSGIEEETAMPEGFAGHVETSEIKMLDFSTMTKQSGKFSF